MPYAHVNGINLYYEVHGDGPNLTLIEGLGYHTWMWFKQIPAFAPHFRTLIYDNRGVGLSEKPPGPYSHETNADDLGALLDHLNWSRTHVLGVSMGGFIAQEFALKYPLRLDRLVLVSTGFGGPNMVPVPPEAIEVLVPHRPMTVAERIRQAIPLVYGDPAWPQRHPEEFADIVRWREEMPQPPEANLAQAMAALTFNTENRLGDIRAPTLVITGSEDRVVPPQNSVLLAEAIPGAHLDVIEGTGHHAWYERADRFNRDVIAFLEGNGGGI